MNLEERVLAARAKFQEAAEELLEAVASSPGAVAEIMRVAQPGQGDTGWTARRLVQTTLTCPHGRDYEERFEVPNVFLELGRWAVRREAAPVDVLVPSGHVYVMVGMAPENEAESELHRRLAAGTIAADEYARRMREEKAKTLYEGHDLMELVCDCAEDER